MVKNPLANERKAKDTGSSPGSGRSPEEGNGNPLQYSCLENPMDRGAWWATVHGVAMSQDITEHTHTHTHTHPLSLTDLGIRMYTSVENLYFVYHIAKPCLSPL